MPLVGDSKAAGDVIDVVSMDNSGLNGNDLMANGTGNGYDNNNNNNNNNILLFILRQFQAKKSPIKGAVHKKFVKINCK